jgi:hypothetical protein
MAPSSSGLGYLVFIQEIAGSNPAGVTPLSGVKPLRGLTHLTLLNRCADSHQICGIIDIFCW